MIWIVRTYSDLSVKEWNVYIGTRTWSIVQTKGFSVKGGYGHSSAWDPITQRIYVYGGLIYDSSATPALSHNLYAYEPFTHEW